MYPHQKEGSQRVVKLPRKTLGGFRSLKIRNLGKCCFQLRYVSTASASMP